MSVLITGATGFIGINLAERMISDGVQVRALAQTNTKPETENARYLRSLGVEFVEGSVTHDAALQRAVASAETVIHLAAAQHEANVPDQHFVDVNVGGTKRLLTHSIRAGVQKFIYHRPAHGAGVEGHQAPYLALGDYTMMRRNMCFSEEPGLYDPENGCGFNWSDTVVVGRKSGYRMSRVPYTKEWCWVKL